MDIPSFALQPYMYTYVCIYDDDDDDDDDDDGDDDDTSDRLVS